MKTLPVDMVAWYAHRLSTLVWYPCWGMKRGQGENTGVLVIENTMGLYSQPLLEVLLSADKMAGLVKHIRAYAPVSHQLFFF
jgi:hypothetical protein